MTPVLSGRPAEAGQVGRHIPLRAVLCLAAVLMIAPALQAQQNTPHIGYVYPAGGRQGSSFEVTVGGQFLDGVKQAYVSGADVQASVVKHVKLLTQGQFNQLREQLMELTAKKEPTAEDRKTIAEIRQKMATFIRRPASPAIAETVTLQVTVAPGAAPGERELRLAPALGLTNPLVFCVGQLPEFSKPAAKVSAEPGTNVGARFRNQPNSGKPEAPMNITLPATVNGQVGPGGVDRCRFQAIKGQHLVVACSARELIPYISDAVPGWFQATLALYDAKGKEVDYAGAYRFHPDPVLHYQIPGDGEYVLEIKDSIYRGREDFVYRITLGELPFVTGIFPLGGKAGARTAVQVKGWNLPVTRITQDNRGKAEGTYPVSVRQGEWISNRVPFAVDKLPESTEKEPNNQAKGAQRVKLPLIVNGRIDRPGDQDVFRFQGRAGEEIVAEVFARRLDSPLDSLLKLTDSTGKQLAANDDHEDKGAGLLTHHADSLIGVKLPKNGTYYLYLGDTQRKGGVEYAYRLRIRRPQPDFELRVTPSGISLRPGATVPITVYALRKDGFAGDIRLTLKDASAGFALSGGWVPANQDKARLTLTAPPGGFDEPRGLTLEGRATIQGREVRRPGIPAEDVMQAFAYRHLVPARELLVRVSGPARSRIPWKIPSDDPVKLPAGGTAPVQLFLPIGRLAGQIQLTLNEPPEGIAIQSLSLVRDGVSILLRADAGKVKPGLKGNLIVEAFLERTAGAGDAKKQPANRRQPLGMLPAIAFEVVAAPQARR
jgi:hypothetical protein